MLFLRCSLLNVLYVYFILNKEWRDGLYSLYIRATMTMFRIKLVGSSGLEPPTSRLSGVRSNHLSYEPIWWRWTGSNRWPPACKAGALPAELHPHTVLQGLFSFPTWTSKIKQRFSKKGLQRRISSLSDLRSLNDVTHSLLLRKEVIQPHLPIRLPCYDFTPVANPTFGSVLLR